MKTFALKYLCLKYFNFFQVVVITGASSGIGEALAHVFYEQGCKVVLAARRKNELDRVKEDLQSKKLVLKVH